jgi:hypothetical protein
VGEGEEEEELDEIEFGILSSSLQANKEGVARADEEQHFVKKEVRRTNSDRDLRQVWGLV